jgi:hypothetical protein
MRLNRDKARQLEEELRRLATVGFAQIHFDAQGEIASVDLVADRRRPAKSIVRDVEILFRRYGVELDHRKVGVAQLQTPAEELRRAGREEAGAEPDGAGGAAGQPAVLEVVDEAERLRLVAVHSTTRHGTLSVEVELSLGAFEGIPGRFEGPAQDAVSAVTVVASATLAAVRNLLQPGYEGLVREVRILQVGQVDLVCLVIDFGRGRAVQRLVGACLDRGSLYDTAVYATLDAINRPLGRANFAQLAVIEGHGDTEGGLRAASA